MKKKVADLTHGFCSKLKAAFLQKAAKISPKGKFEKTFRVPPREKNHLRICKGSSITSWKTSKSSRVAFASLELASKFCPKAKQMAEFPPSEKIQGNRQGMQDISRWVRAPWSQETLLCGPEMEKGLSGARKAPSRSWEDACLQMEPGCLGQPIPLKRFIGQAVGETSLQIPSVLCSWAEALSRKHRRGKPGLHPAATPCKGMVRPQPREQGFPEGNGVLCHVPRAGAVCWPAPNVTIKTPAWISFSRSSENPRKLEEGPKETEERVCVCGGGGFCQFKLPGGLLQGTIRTWSYAGPV